MTLMIVLWFISGYWEKQRYKGQITISFQLVAAKVMVRKDSEEDKSPKIVDINAMLTPFKVKHSYENMTLIEEEDTGPKARKILEYSYEEEPEQKNCCWCCLPFFCCTSKPKKQKKGSVKSAIVTEMPPPKTGADLQKSSSSTSLALCDVMVSLPAQPSSPIKSGSTYFKTKKLSPLADVKSDTDSSPSKSDSLDTNSNRHIGGALTQLSNENGDSEGKNIEASLPGSKPEKGEKGKKKKAGKKKTKGDSAVESKLNGNIAPDNQNGINIDNKENSDPTIWDIHKNDTKNSTGNDRVPKSLPPKSLNTKSPPLGMKRSETYELVERWKSEGRAYQTARDQFFSFFDSNVQGQIIRYFEQERSTLVLQVNLEEKMSVRTICMTTREVKKLREAYEMGALHEDLVRCVRPQDLVDKMECCAIHLRTVINDDDFALSYQELA